MDLAVRSWMPPMAHCPHEEQWFNSSAFATAPVILDSLKTHGVNNAQAVKHGVVWARQSGEVQQGFAESWLAWSQLQRFHGQPHGAFSADEHLAGTNPSRGTELCAVVEAMWSLLLTAQLAPNDRSADYPFNAGVEYWIQNEEPFQLTIRLPPFLRDDPSAAASLRVTLEGRTVNRTVVDGFLRVQVTSKAERPRLAVRLDFALEPRVHVGPLLMALDLAEERKEVRRHAFEAADWDTFTRKSWQVALPETPRFGDVRHRSFDLPPLPHDAARCPLALEAELVGVRWPAEHQAPAAPPEALKPTCCRCERLIAKKGGMFSSTVYGKDCQVGTSGKGSKNFEQEDGEAPADGAAEGAEGEEELGWAVDTNAEGEDYAADLAQQTALQLEAEAQSGKGAAEGDLEREALEEDFQLTKDLYSQKALDEGLKPMQDQPSRRSEAVKRVQSRVTFPANTSLVEVYPGTIMLGDATGCRDIPALRRFHVKKACSDVELGQDTPGEKWREEAAFAEDLILLPDARHIANNEQIADVLVAACKTDQMTDHVRLEMVKAFEMKESENSEMNFAGHPLGTIGAQAVAEALFQ
eukprot:g27135.t1